MPGPIVELEAEIPGGSIVVVFRGARAETAARSLRAGIGFESEGAIVNEAWKTQRTGLRSRIVMEAHSIRICPELTVQPHEPRK